VNPTRRQHFVEKASLVDVVCFRLPLELMKWAGIVRAMAHCAQGCFRCAATADAFQFLLDAQNQWCGKDTVHLRPFVCRVQQELLDGHLSEEPSLFVSEI